MIRLLRWRAWFLSGWVAVWFWIINTLYLKNLGRHGRGSRAVCYGVCYGLCTRFVKIGMSNNWMGRSRETRPTPGVSPRSRNNKRNQRVETLWKPGKCYGDMLSLCGRPGDVGGTVYAYCPNRLGEGANFLSFYPRECKHVDREIGQC